MSTRTRSDAKGGTAATAGFRYQFLRTAEIALDQHERDPSGTWVIRVESDDDDAVDYQVLSAPHGPAILTAQVKSSLPGSATTMTRPDALKILAHLTARHPGNVALDTNRHLNGAALALAYSLEHHQPVTELGDLKAARASIRRDERNVPAIQSALTARVQRLRAQASVPASPAAAALVTAALIDLIFERATRRGQHTITATDVAHLLEVHGADLANALGRSPTWIPLQAPLSAEQSVIRESVSSHLDAVLNADVFASGVPESAAITGAPGIGKSSAVAAWARSKRQRYTVSIWITAGSTAAILEQVRALLVTYSDLGEATAATEDIQASFRTFMAALPFPWLLIFDGVAEPTEVDGWVPGGGSGHVVYTSVDTTWPTGICQSVELRPIRGGEARQLLLMTLGNQLEDLGPEELGTLDAMTSALGGWPLALVTAGSWLRDCRGGISGIDAYLTELTDIDLDSADFQPYGYPRTAVAAVLAALSGMRAPDTQHGAAAYALLLAVTHLGSVDVPARMAARLAGAQGTPLSTSTLDRSVKLLRQRGLIQRRTLPPSIDPAFGDRLTVHNVIGQIACSQQPLSDLLEADARAAHLLEGGISAAWQDNLLSTAFSLLPPATRVLQNLMRPTIPNRVDNHQCVVSLPALILMGHVAKLESLQGRPDTAVYWLETEIELLDVMATAADAPGLELAARSVARNRLIAHCDLLFATHSQRDLIRLPLVYERGVDALKTAVHRGVEQADLDEAAATLLQAIDAIPLSLGARARLLTDLIGCRSGAPTGGRAEIIWMLHQAEQRAVDDPAAGLDACRDIAAIATHPFDKGVAQFLMAECLARTDQPLLASEAVVQALHDCAQSGLPIASIHDAALQVGHELAISLLKEPDEAAPAEALATVLEELADQLDTANVGTRARHLTQRAVHSTLAGHPDSSSHCREAREEIDAALAAQQIQMPMYEGLTGMIAYAEQSPEPSIWQRATKIDGIEIYVGNGGDTDVSTTFFSHTSTPTVAFVHPNPPRLHRGGIAIDALRYQLHQAGLPESHEPRVVPTLRAWTARLDAKSLTVADAEGNPWLTHPTDEIPPVWISAATRASKIWFVYGGHTSSEIASISDGSLAASNAYIPLTVVGARKHRWRALMSRATARRQRD